MSNKDENATKRLIEGIDALTSLAQNVSCTVEEAATSLQSLAHYTYISLPKTNISVERRMPNE